MPFFLEIVDGKFIPTNKKIIVFGNGGHTRTINGYFHDENIVEGFVVDDDFVKYQSDIGGVSVCPLSEVVKIFPPEEYSMLVALGFKNLNQLRCEKTEMLSKLGYTFVGFIDRSARVPRSYSVGANTIIIGNVDIHEGVVIGCGVFVSSGAVIGHDSVLEDYSWIGSGAVLAGCVNIGAFSVLGMNATVRQNGIISHHSLISPNTFVNANTNPYASLISSAGKVVPIDSRKTPQACL